MTMSNYIEAATFSISPGALAGTMQFRTGLNLLSGENGTFKTKLLQNLRSGASLKYHEDPPAASPRVQAISPKRNAQRRAVQEIYNELRRNDTKLEAVLNARNVQDATFEAYPSIGELFYAVFNDFCRDGGNQVEKMEQAAAGFNAVIKRIFEHYDLQAVWDDALGAPRISLLKHDATQVPLDGLSLGEQEILSLATYIHSSRDTYDIFLIDEPEVHLNWHLEERLFDFLDAFCDLHQKQMIVVTHSRMVFTTKFLNKTQFLFWEGGQVKWGPELAAEQRRRLAGDAIEIIRLGTFTKPTFFVEDACQETIVTEIARVLDADVAVSPCGNKANVRSLYRYAQNDRWTNSYFVEDGDNERSPFADPRFIHLGKYCVECYLLDPAIASAVVGKTETEVRQATFDAIVENKGTIFRKNKFFEFLIDHLTIDHVTAARLAMLDASLILPAFLERLGYGEAGYIRGYIQVCHSRGLLNSILPAEIVDVVERSLADTVANDVAEEQASAEG